MVAFNIGGDWTWPDSSSFTGTFSVSSNAAIGIDTSSGSITIGNALASGVSLGNGGFNLITANSPMHLNFTTTFSSNLISNGTAQFNNDFNVSTATPIGIDASAGNAISIANATATGLNLGNATCATVLDATNLKLASTPNVAAGVGTYVNALLGAGQAYLVIDTSTGVISSVTPS